MARPTCPVIYYAQDGQILLGLEMSVLVQEQLRMLMPNAWNNVVARGQLPGEWKQPSGTVHQEGEG